MFCFFCFFFNDTAPTEIYTLSLHDALPISTSTCELFDPKGNRWIRAASLNEARAGQAAARSESTRLNSSHRTISYAVFCLKKKNTHLHPHLLAPNVPIQPRLQLAHDLDDFR